MGIVVAVGRAGMYLIEGQGEEVWGDQVLGLIDKNNLGLERASNQSAMKSSQDLATELSW